MSAFGAGQPDPWERQPGEPPKGYAAFCAYRDMGPRRGLRPAAKVFYGEGAGKAKVRQLEKWSSAWGWPARAQAWDQHVEEEGRAAAIEEVRAMRRRHAQVANAMLQRVSLRLAGGRIPTAGGEIEVEPIDVNRLKPHELARMAEVATRIEKAARGEPEVTVAAEHRHADAPENSEQDVARAILGNPELARMAAQIAASLPGGGE